MAKKTFGSTRVGREMRLLGPVVWRSGAEDMAAVSGSDGCGCCGGEEELTGVVVGIGLDCAGRGTGQQPVAAAERAPCDAKRMTSPAVHLATAPPHQQTTPPPATIKQIQHQYYVRPHIRRPPRRPAAAPAQPPEANCYRRRSAVEPGGKELIEVRRLARSRCPPRLATSTPAPRPGTLPSSTTSSARSSASPHPRPQPPAPARLPPRRGNLRLTRPSSSTLAGEARAGGGGCIVRAARTGTMRRMGCGVLSTR